MAGSHQEKWTPHRLAPANFHTTQGPTHNYRTAGQATLTNNQHNMLSMSMWLKLSLPEWMGQNMPELFICHRHGPNAKKYKHDLPTTYNVQELSKWELAQPGGGRRILRNSGGLPMFFWEARPGNPGPRDEPNPLKLPCALQGGWHPASGPQLETAGPARPVGFGFAF